MLRSLLAVCLCSLAPARAEEPKPSLLIAGALRFEAPKGWQREEYSNGGGADPVEAFVSGEDRIIVRVFGAPGSGYKDAASFLAGPGASTMGQPPEKAGSARVSGRERSLYKRGFPINQGDPHVPSGRQQMLGRELFLILPAAKGRFAVLSYSRESPAPDLERRGEKAWAAFLKTVKLAGRKT